MRYLNPYRIPRCKHDLGSGRRLYMVVDRDTLLLDSTKWEAFNALSTRKPEDMVPVE